MWTRRLVQRWPPGPATPAALPPCPAEIPAHGRKRILRRTFRESSHDRVLSVAGGVAFFLLPALFPAITACISICGLLADPAMIAAHLDDLSSGLPAGAVKIGGDHPLPARNRMPKSRHRWPGTGAFLSHGPTCC